MRNVFDGLTGDGSKWGLSDWYKEREEAIRVALAEGREAEWTTGWWASKKEVASGCVSCLNGTLTCRASTWDDLDVPGNGVVEIPWTDDFDALVDAVDEAHARAQADLHNNGLSIYQGWSIHARDEASDGGIGGWIETYIERRCMMDSPPGDTYARWGWQGEHEIPPEAKAAIERYIGDCETEPDEPVLVGDYWLQAWKD